MEMSSNLIHPIFLSRCTVSHSSLSIFIDIFNRFGVNLLLEGRWCCWTRPSYLHRPPGTWCPLIRYKHVTLGFLGSLNTNIMTATVCKLSATKCTRWPPPTLELPWLLYLKYLILYYVIKIPTKCAGNWKTWYYLIFIIFTFPVHFPFLFFWMILHNGAITTFTISVSRVADQLCFLQPQDITAICVAVSEN